MLYDIFAHYIRRGVSVKYTKIGRVRMEPDDLRISSRVSSKLIKAYLDGMPKNSKGVYGCICLEDGKKLDCGFCFSRFE